jgi:hypothetical protein
MPDQLKNVIIITVVIFLLILLWAVSIGITYWDAVSRRKLPGIETAAWVGLVVLLPGIGFAAYLFARLLGSVLSPNQPAAEKPRRVTMVKRQFDPDRRKGTIPAAEFLQPNASETSSIPQAWAEMNSRARKYKISIIAGPLTGVAYILESFPVQIGRGLDVSIRLDEDRGVSRLHAEIYQQSGVLRIRDLNSTHGTKVNDFSITDKSLDPGDEIRLGGSVLVVGVQEETE